MEYRLGSRYFYLAPGDLSVARQDVLPTLAAFPTGHYHGITVTVDPGLAPRCLSCFLEDVEVQPAALAEKFCAAGGDVLFGYSGAIFERLRSPFY